MCRASGGRAATRRGHVHCRGGWLQHGTGGRSDATAPTRSYASYRDFYREVYGPNLTETHPFGRLGVTLLASRQTRGDWSDAPVPELVITRLVADRIDLTMDVGGGAGATGWPRATSSWSRRPSPRPS